MTERSLLSSPAPYHVLSYGALLGTQFFHTFINSIISFKVLTRPQFGVLQRAVFPAYFGIQTVAPVVVALTYPGGRLAAGISGVLHPSNRWGVLAPLSVAFVTGLANLVYFLPKTNELLEKRKRQEVESKTDSSGPSDKLKALNRQFAKVHGYSSLFNLVSFIATVVYGVHLAARIQ